MRSRRQGVLALVVMVLAVVMLSAGSADAALFGIGSDCKSAPTPHRPGSGFSGFIDPGPANPSGTPGYQLHGYPPPVSTYDTGCVPDPATELDTTFSNWVTGAATAIVATTTALHRLVSPPTFLNRLDPVVTQGTAAISAGLFAPWLPLSVLILGAGLVWSARRRDMAGAVSTVGWSLLVLTAAAAVISMPVQAGRAADSFTTATVGAVNTALSGQPAAADPSDSRATLLTDSVLYPQWLRAELGSSDSAVAVKYGPALLDAQELTWAEVRTVDANPGAGKAIVKAKQTAFKDLAGKIENEDPDAYEHLKGRAGGRLGPSFIALVGAVLTAPFLILADLLIVAALLILRFLAMFFPAVAVIGLHPATSGAVKRVGSTALAAVVNSVVFAVGGSLDALTAGILLDPKTHLPPWAALLLCGVVTVILWSVLKPFRHLTAMVGLGTASASAGAGLLGKAGRAAMQLAALRVGAGAGVAAAISSHEEKVEDSERREATAPRAEVWSRSQGAMTPAVDGGWRHLPTGAPATAPPAVSRPVAELPVSPVSQDRAAATTTPVRAPAAIEAVPRADEPARPPAGLPNAPPPVAELPVAPAVHAPPVQAHEVDSGQVLADPPQPDVWETGRRAHEDRPVLRADPVVDSNGAVTYRVWDADSQSYITVGSDWGQSDA